MATSTQDRSPHGRSVRELIEELAGTEDALRQARADDTLDHRSLVVRRQATIVRELRRRARHPR
ncbi:hypothetical protein [Phycicoccus sonneratiae]|uniref:Uncharacterized protein n=1 Tax=Phycicoccus sonneratiae TaxID=2807628 RepID=A0ABS2CJB2_9MICO|nr:hypothetical protein [Phycicoccus sonneraticus]MBM6399266.1 hypothetical protein [Phycicoccus sonneraticus]